MNQENRSERNLFSLLLSVVFTLSAHSVNLYVFKCLWLNPPLCTFAVRFMFRYTSGVHEVFRYRTVYRKLFQIGWFTIVHSLELVMLQLFSSLSVSDVDGICQQVGSSWGSANVRSDIVGRLGYIHYVSANCWMKIANLCILWMK